jgi:outer membrane lipoprotein-sorting protein
MEYMKTLNKILLFAFMLAAIAFPQTNDPDVILKKVLETFNKVQDYEVNVNIKVDVDFLKVPDTEAKIYFKQPDKVHFESATFALLPREGFDFSPSALLKKKYTAFYERVDTIDDFRTAVVKVIPLGETDDVILSTLWIDQSKNVIRKIESSTKTKGTFTIELKYDNTTLNYYLPSKMIFSFNVDKMNIPMGFSGDMNPESKERKKDNKPTTAGKVYVSYSNYKINIGLSDKIFENKKKK